MPFFRIESRGKCKVLAGYNWTVCVTNCKVLAYLQLLDHYSFLSLVPGQTLRAGLHSTYVPGYSYPSLYLLPFLTVCMVPRDGRVAHLLASVDQVSASPKVWHHFWRWARLHRFSTLSLGSFLFIGVNATLALDSRACGLDWLAAVHLTHGICEGA